jgi:hypothetical protein
MAIVLDGTSGITNDSGYTGDGVSFADSTPANTLVTTSDGNVGIGTSSPDAPLQVGDTNITPSAFPAGSVVFSGASAAATESVFSFGRGDSGGNSNTGITFSFVPNRSTTGNATGWYQRVDGATAAGFMSFGQLIRAASGNATLTERARIDSDGNLLVGTTDTAPADENVTGVRVGPTGRTQISGSGNPPITLNRLQDGSLVEFKSAGTTEGSISVSGTTVSYNGGHLARWAQTTTAKDESLVKGTVLSNLDAMNVYVDADGNPVQNEQLNKVKVSDVEGDANVAGVFVNWEHDEAHNVDEINMAMTGDMIIRIAQGVTVARGDLLMSAGDGTAKPQGDDIVRAKTIAKVTSTHVTCTYADGSFCVPCVLMAC